MDGNNKSFCLLLLYINASIRDVIFCSFTITRLQVILDVGVEIPTHAAGSTYKLRAELDVNGAAASLPRQREALLLRHQHVL